MEGNLSLRNTIEWQFKPSQRVKRHLLALQIHACYAERYYINFKPFRSIKRHLVIYINAWCAEADMLVNVWGNQGYGVKRKLKPQKLDQINDSYSEKACQVYTIPNVSRGHNREPWFIPEVALIDFLLRYGMFYSLERNCSSRNHEPSCDYLKHMSHSSHLCDGNMLRSHWFRVLLTWKEKA